MFIPFDTVFGGEPVVVVLAKLDATLAPSLDAEASWDAGWAWLLGVTGVQLDCRLKSCIVWQLCSLKNSNDAIANRVYSISWRRGILKKWSIVNGKVGPLWKQSGLLFLVKRRFASDIVNLGVFYLTPDAMFLAHDSCTKKCFQENIDDSVTK